jgi:hypothetical protein
MIAISIMSGFCGVHDKIACLTKCFEVASEFEIEMISSTVMRFSVRVPVLSVQMTVADPSVSILGMFLVKTFFLATRIAPRERNIVNTTGNSSGSSDMAIAIEERIEVNSERVE